MPPFWVSGKPIHSCSVSPQLIRKEVESLKTDFNCRMKQVLFSSVLSAYYSGFVPCCFAQVTKKKKKFFFYAVNIKSSSFLMPRFYCFRFCSLLSTTILIGRHNTWLSYGWGASQCIVLIVTHLHIVTLSTEQLCI